MAELLFQQISRLTPLCNRRQRVRKPVNAYLRQPLDLDIAVHDGAARIVGLEGEGAFADAAARFLALDLGERIRVLGVIRGQLVVDFYDDVVSLDDDLVLEP